MIRRALFWLGLALVLGVANWQIVAKQAILDAGTVILVPLRPVDPRSLMQGDYMALAYDVALSEAAPRRGVLVATLDADGVAMVLRLDEGAPLAAGEHRLAYRRDAADSAVFAADSFLFQEGEASRYQAARFAVLKVAADGTALLAGLADAERRTIAGP